MKKHCDYPDCKCPFDAPADPNWCALGLPVESPAPYGYTYETNGTWVHFTKFKVPSDAYDEGTLVPLYVKP